MGCSYSIVHTSNETMLEMEIEKVERQLNDKMRVNEIEINLNLKPPMDELSHFIERFRWAE